MCEAYRAVVISMQWAMGFAFMGGFPEGRLPEYFSI
jgi:hypothetical protein